MNLLKKTRMLTASPLSRVQSQTLGGSGLSTPSIPLAGSPTPFTQAVSSPRITPEVPLSPAPGRQSQSPSMSRKSVEMPRSPRMTADDEAMIEQIMSEKGTEDQLLTFFDRYSRHRKFSSRCALDGRYFWKVLAPYEGLVPSELYLRINQGELVDDESEGPSREFTTSDVAFDVNELAQTKNSPVRYRLIKMILDISNDPTSNTGSVHSNLIYIDTKTKEIIRFDPIFDEYYTEPVNTILEDYFKEILPEYEYMMANEHPQLPSTDTCPTKGMCAAYVLKKAMTLVTGLDEPMVDPKAEELKILRFADAIETEYGILPNSDQIEAGLGIGLFFGPRMHAIGAPYMNPYGPVITPAMYPGLSMYSPQYYGYAWGPRFARRPGWGWGSRRWRHWGAWAKEYGVWEKSKKKVTDVYGKAKERIKGAGLKAQAKLKGQRTDYSGMSDAEMNKEIYGVSRKGKPVDFSDQYSHEEEQDLQAYGGVESKVMALQKAGRKEYGHEYGCGHDHGLGPRKEYGCGCSGCKTAPPRGEFGYWRRDEYGSRKWKPIAYGGAVAAEGEAYGGASAYQGRVLAGYHSDPKFIAQQGETIRKEYGCGCMRSKAETLGDGDTGPPRKEYGLFDPGSWQPETRTAVGGAAIGAGAGALLGGGWRGALLGAAAGGIGGYMLGKKSSGTRQRYEYQQPPPQYYQQQYPQQYQGSYYPQQQPSYRY